MPIFIYMGYYLYDHFHAQTFRITVGKASSAFGLLCLEGIIIFQHEGIDKNFSFFFLCDRLFCQCLPAIVLLKSYNLQYLKQMSIALYFRIRILSSGLYGF